MRATCLAFCFALLALPGSLTPLAGTWVWQGPQDADFQLTIREKSDHLSGVMTGTMFKGNRVSTGVFSGTRTGDSATLTWSFTDGDQAGPEAGTARLESITAKTIGWRLEYNGKDDCWFPRGVILKRKVRPVRRAH